jgi:hypothetical protein
MSEFTLGIVAGRAHRREGQCAIIGEIHQVKIMFRRLLCVSFVAGVVCAQEPTSCTISGTVKDDVTGIPVANATLYVEEQNKKPVKVTNASDDTGGFTLSVGAGMHDITAWARGYSEELNKLECKEGAAKGQHFFNPLYERTRVWYELGAFDFALHAEAVITGRVTDDEDRPLPGAKITALRREYVAGEKRLVDAMTATAGVNGLFTIDSLRNGSYYLVAFAPRGAEKTRTSDVRYVPTFYPSAIDGYAGAPIRIRGPGEMSGIDIAVRKARAFSVRGNLTMVDEQVPGNYSVRLTPTDLHSFAYSREIPISDVKKEFEFSGVTPGAYILSAQSDHVPVAFARAMVDIRDGDVEGIDLVLARGNSISVIFTTEDNNRALLPEGSDRSRVVLLKETKYAEIGLLACGSTYPTEEDFRPEIDSKGEPVSYMGPWRITTPVLLRFCRSVADA